MSVRWVCVPVVVLALLIAGCGSGADTENAESQPVTPSPTSTPLADPTPVEQPVDAGTEVVDWDRFAPMWSADGRLLIECPPEHDEGEAEHPEAESPDPPQLMGPYVGFVVTVGTPALLDAEVLVGDREPVLGATTWAKGMAAHDDPSVVFAVHGAALADVDTVLFRQELSEVLADAPAGWFDDKRLLFQYIAPDEDAGEDFTREIGVSEYVLWLDDEGRAGLLLSQRAGEWCRIDTWLSEQSEAAGLLHDRTYNPASFLADAVAGGTAMYHLQRTYEEISFHDGLLAQRRRDERWLASPPEQRLAGDAPAAVHERYTPFSVALFLPESWVDIDLSLCTWNRMGWGSSCYRFGGLPDPGGPETGQTVVLVRVIQYDDEPPELVVARTQGLYPDRLAALGTVVQGPPGPTGFTELQLIPGLPEVNSDDDLLALLEAHPQGVIQPRE